MADLDILQKQFFETFKTALTGIGAAASTQAASTQTDNDAGEYMGLAKDFIATGQEAVRKKYFTEYKNALVGEGSAARADAEENVLATHSRLAGVIMKSGASTVDVALSKDNVWLARELAIASQIESDPALKKAYNEKLAAARKAAQQENPEGFNIDFAAKDKVQIDFIKSLPDDAKLTPAMKRMKNHIKFAEWRDVQDTKTEFGIKYLHLAASQDRVDIMEAIKIEMEGNIRGRMPEVASDDKKLQELIREKWETMLTTKNYDMETPLIAAAKNGKLKAAEYLIKNLANPTVESARGGSAAHYAAVHNHQPMLQLLAKHGFDIHAPNRFAETPLDVAMLAGNKEIVTYLAQQRGKETPQGYLDAALSRATTPDMAQYIITLGANPKNTGGKSHNSPLLSLGSHGESALEAYYPPLQYKKVKADNDGLLDLLLQQGADPNQKPDYQTPLHSAINNKLEMKTFLKLVEKTKDLKVTDNSGITVLHYAAMRGHAEAVKALLAKDPELAKVKSNGQTPLMYALTVYAPYAEETKKMNVLRELVKGGGLDETDKAGMTPLAVVAQSLTYTSATTPKEVLANRLELMKLLRTDLSASKAYKWPGFNRPMNVTEYMRAGIEELVKDSQKAPLTPQQIDQMKYLEEAIKAMESPAAPQGLGKAMDEALKKAASAIPKQNDISLSIPSEKASSLPIKPNNPKLSV